MKYEERMEEVKYLGTNLTNQISIQEEIKSRLKSGNACYHSVQNLLSSSLLSNNLKVKVYRTIILPVVLYGCETWSLIIRLTGHHQALSNVSLRCCFRYSDPNIYFKRVLIVLIHIYITFYIFIN